MKSHLASLLSCSALFAFSTADAFSQAGTPVPTKLAPPNAPEPAKTPPRIRYKPPVAGAPVVRGTGGSRGGSPMPALYVLAPVQEGRTTNPRPTVFWFQSAPANADFELTLTEPMKPQPLLFLKGSRQQSAGIHSLSLSRRKITLKPNVSYLWNVALIPNSKGRSADTFASGGIRYVEAPADLKAKIQSASQAERATIYAEAGYWYDAIQSISTAIAAEPDNKALHRLRASLLEQGKLKEVAAAEKKY